MGDLSSLIFVHPLQTVSEVNSLIRIDVLRNITGRYRVYHRAPLYAKSMQMAMLNVNVYPPRRFYFRPFVRSTIQLCEFEYRDIGVQAIIESAKLLFGLRLLQWQIQMFPEMSKIIETYFNLRYTIRERELITLFPRSYFSVLPIGITQGT